MVNSTETNWTTHSTQNGTIIGSFEGEPQNELTPTVLLPGIGANAESLKRLASELHILGHNVITADTGAAYSSMGYFRKSLGHAWTMSDFGRLLFDAVDEEFDNRPINVVGHSWGGIFAQDIASGDPGRVERLVLMATPPGGNPNPAPSPSVIWEMLQPDRSRGRLRSVAGKLYGGDFRDKPQLVDELGMAHDVDSLAYMRQHTAALACAASGLTNRIKHIKAPTVVIAGTDDPIIPHQNAVALSGRIPGSSLHILEDGGHMFPMSRAKETAEIIDGHLRST